MRRRSPLIAALQHMHWTETMTLKVTNETKLVGALISCEGAPEGGDPQRRWRSNPHVLPHAWATDRVGEGMTGKVYCPVAYVC
jgi:hypothetical protein